MSKYHAIKTEVDGVMFDSKREAERYRELKLMQQAGVIEHLELQAKFPVKVNGKHICNYFADFIYTERGAPIVEDCKGMRTAAYRLKKKLVEALYEIEIKET